VKVGLVVGVFDLFHQGHVRLLARARAQVDKLVVVVNGDRLTAAYKRPPVFSEAERLEIVQSCRHVDEAMISNDYDVSKFLYEYRPAYIFHGDDWERTSYLKQIRATEELLAEIGAQLVFLPYTSTVSTTSVIRRCATSPAAA
jgi:glycerol-3-phosphate cytidylyltransferase